MQKNIFLTFKGHFFFWLVYYVFCYCMDQLSDKTMTWDVVLLFLLSNNILLFYSFSYCFARASLDGFKGLAFTITRFFGAVLLFLFVRYLVRYWFMATYIRRDLGDLELQEWLITGTVWVINYLFYASAYYFFKSSISKQSKINHFQQEHHEQETKILQKEKDLLAMENRVLRTQINPHVLYNTLNFLYAKSLPVSEELSNGILTLSEIMQYSLKNQDSNGLVPLLDELEHIQNVISLAQLKSNGKAYINLRYEEFDETILVVPLLLITLVENIFKHGDVSDPNHPAIISLRREVGGNLNFHASNKPGKASPMPGTSLGLGNVRMRMENEYGTDGKMNVTRSESSFEVEISIPIRTTPKSNKPEPFASASAA